MSNIVDDVKREFAKSENALVKIILVNVAVFLTLLLLKIILTLSQSANVYTAVINTLQLPAATDEFLYRPWTLITYFFTHDDIFHILFNMLFLYWFGKLIDEYLGAKRVIALYMLGGIAGGLIYIVLYNALPYFQAHVEGSRMLGASAAAFSVAVGASTLLPNYTFNLIFLGPIRIKFIALFYIILSLAQTVGPNAGGNLAHLGGAFVGYVFIKLLQSGTDLGKPLYAVMNVWSRLFRKRPSMQVTYRERQVYRSTSVYSSASSSGTIEMPDQTEIDSILDKISKSGYESLTREEKQKLFKASQQK
ncbi:MULTISPECIES: rhomboid family intramembrane serine protease [Dyadobacter]|uniref:Rhomboid family intramembrane serine protease n=1 Tax=Dyadobacter chenhuakuii TaxID=2909339 RepID=A0A9X1QG63_9BACT|nr:MULTISPECIES: rhomboid family intramembrane serine protease [Dyadobacter]MCF2495832.1 rhomboid family intramembrane serine protease [Dyadobacter chenhuakuii]MCF2499728.1 rhomboid family intramembrane serine protease [Dyadobacter chenhuakuii]MCF2521003.1 rhomboid family intramembrane serine protease [Dyadobacter sp. CY351]USJ29861.1 rhomboid family intramembrane serine protease [Dyadobacter chenhuakuii]